MESSGFVGFPILLLSFLGLVFIFCSFFVDWRLALKEARRIRVQIWILLGVIVTMALVVRISAYEPIHMMYMDEFLYMEEAKNIGKRGEAVSCRVEIEEICGHPFSKGQVWPFLLFVWFRLFGESSLTAFYLVRVLSLGTILLSFLFSYLLSKKESVALWCSFILAFSPLHAFWSNTLETAIPSLFFVMLTLLLLLLFLERTDPLLGILVFIAYVFAAWLRFENLLLLPVIMLAVSFHSPLLPPYARKTIKLFLPTIYLATLIAIIAVMYATISEFLPYLEYYFRLLYFLNVPFFIQQLTLYFILAIPLVAGLVVVKDDPLRSTIVIFPLLIFSSVYLPLASETRTLIVPLTFCAILSAFGIEMVSSKFKQAKNVVQILLSFGIVLSLAMAVDNDPSDRLPDNRKNLYLLETLTAPLLEDYIPPNCSVISSFPQTVGAHTDFMAISTTFALENKEYITSLVNRGGCVYYFRDQFCYPAFKNTVMGDLTKECDAMQSQFRLKAAKNFTNGNYTFAIFQLLPNKVE
jgi:hypothetical protein